MPERVPNAPAGARRQVGEHRLRSGYRRAAGGPQRLKRNRTGLGSGPALRKVSHCCPAVSRESVHGVRLVWTAGTAAATSDLGVPHPVTDERENRTAGEDDPDECSDHAEMVPSNCSVQPFWSPRSHPSPARAASTYGKAPTCHGRRGPPGVPNGPPQVGSRPGGARTRDAASTRGRIDTAPSRILAQKLCSATGAGCTFCRVRHAGAVSSAGPRSSPRRGCGRSLRTSRWDHLRLGTRAATRTANAARARSCRGRRCRRPCLRTPERQHSCQPAPGN